ncbi:MAG: corrinoid protein [Dehalococcoidia bacterium]|nr:corrinoid protein [Dehalococcoidia bacterium]
MSDAEHLQALKEAILTMDLEGITAVAQAAMDAGVDPQAAITDGMVPGMVEVGEKFEEGEYFLSELVVAGEVMKDGLKVIEPYISAGATASTKSRAVIATVEGDSHDIGKNIVVTLLGVQGFDVEDLGIDVRADDIVEKVREHKPAVVALSALLSTTMPHMGDVIEALKAAGLRSSVKVIVGGSPVTPAFAASIGADHCAANAIEGVNKCAEWVKK